MMSDTTELKSFSSFLSLNTDNIPKISSAMAYYQRNNDDNPFDFEKSYGKHNNGVQSWL